VTPAVLAPLRRLLLAITAAAVALVALAGPVAPAGPQELPPLPPTGPSDTDPLAPYLELVAPIVSPVCADAALVSLVAPAALGTELAALVSQLIGPFFVVCGSVPLPDGRRTCAADDQVKTVLDTLSAQLATSLPVALVGVGTLVDEVAIIEDRLAVAPPTLAPTLDTVLSCTVATSGVAPDGALPPALPEATLPPAPPASPQPPLSVPVPQAFDLAPLAPPAAVPTPAPAPVVPTQRVAALPSITSFRYPVVFLIPIGLLALGGALVRTLTQPVATRRRPLALADGAR
jgi:hypothetical protein